MRRAAAVGLRARSLQLGSQRCAPVPACRPSAVALVQQLEDALRRADDAELRVAQLTAQLTALTTSEAAMATVPSRIPWFLF